MKLEIMKLNIKEKVETPGVLDIYLYSEITPDGYDYFGNKRQSDTSANHLKTEIESRPNLTQINIYINSAGGSVKEAYGIYAQLKRHPAHVTACIDGFAMSAASIIAMAADEVIMYRNCMMIVHNAMDICFGNATEMRQCADALDKLMEGNRQCYLARAGDKLDEKKLIEMLDAETWLTAAECVQYGLADKIIDEDADLTKAQEVVERMNLNLQQMLEYRRVMLQQSITSPSSNEPSSEKPPERKLQRFFNTKIS